MPFVATAPVTTANHQHTHTRDTTECTLLTLAILEHLQVLQVLQFYTHTQISHQHFKQPHTTLLQIQAALLSTQ